MLDLWDMDAVTLTAYHESGHVLACFSRGVRFSRAWIRAGVGRVEGFSADDRTSLIVLVAGAVAEAIASFDPERRPFSGAFARGESLARTHLGIDAAQVARYARALSPGDWLSAVEAAEALAEARLAHNWRSVERIAAELERVGVLTYEQAAALV